MSKMIEYFDNEWKESLKKMFTNGEVTPDELEAEEMSSLLAYYPSLTNTEKMEIFMEMLESDSRYGFVSDWFPILLKESSLGWWELEHEFKSLVNVAINDDCAETFQHLFNHYKDDEDFLIYICPRINTRELRNLHKKFDYIGFLLAEEIYKKLSNDDQETCASSQLEWLWDYDTIDSLKENNGYKVLCQCKDKNTLLVDHILRMNYDKFFSQVDEISKLLHEHGAKIDENDFNDYLMVSINKDWHGKLSHVDIDDILAVANKIGCSERILQDDGFIEAYLLEDHDPDETASIRQKIILQRQISEGKSPNNKIKI